jgi:hypothetical protein
MKNKLVLLLMVFIFSNCKEKKDFQFQKVYGNIKEETITEYSKLLDKNGKVLWVQKTIRKNKYSKGKLKSSETSQYLNGEKETDNKNKSEYIYDSDNFLIKELSFSEYKKKWLLTGVEIFDYEDSENVKGIDSLNIYLDISFYKDPKKGTTIYSINEEGLVINAKKFIKNPKNPKDSTLVMESFSKYNKKGFPVEYKSIIFEKKPSGINKYDVISNVEYNEFDEIGNWTKRTEKNINIPNNGYSSFSTRKITYK